MPFFNTFTAGSSRNVARPAFTRPFSKPTSLTSSDIRASTATLSFTAGVATVSAPATNHEYQLTYTKKYNIGDVGPGGGVVFITPSTPGNTDGFYYECAPKNWYQAVSGNANDPLLSTSDSSRYTTFESSSFTIGSGVTNQALNANYGIPGNAHYIVKNLTFGGHSDWFIPSLNEAVEMWKCRGAIGDFRRDSGASIYATSTEPNSNSPAATPRGNYFYYIMFPGSTTAVSDSYTGYFDYSITYTNKNVTAYIRPIRRFMPSETTSSWEEIGGGISSKNFTGLSRNTSTSIKVRTKNAYGTSYESETASVTTGNVPGMITNFTGAGIGNTIAPGFGSISYSWTLPSDNGGSPIVGVVLEVTTSGLGFTDRGSLITGTGTTVLWVDDDSNTITAGSEPSNFWKGTNNSLIYWLYTTPYSAGATQIYQSTATYAGTTYSWAYNGAQNVWIHARARALNIYGHGPWSGWTLTQAGGYISPPYFPPFFK